MPPQPTSAEVEFVPPVERPMRVAEREPLDAAATAVVGAMHAPLAPPAQRRKSFPLVPLVLATMLAIVGAYLLSANMGPPRGRLGRCARFRTVKRAAPSLVRERSDKPATVRSTPREGACSSQHGQRLTQDFRVARPTCVAKRQPRHQTAFATRSATRQAVRAPGGKATVQSAAALSAISRPRRPRHQPQRTYPR